MTTYKPEPARTPFILSRQADLSSCAPGAPDSAGARWLRRVESVALEAWEAFADEDPTHESDEFRAELQEALSDVSLFPTVPALWAVFVDLGAYQVNAEELDLGDVADLDRVAELALDRIADRLAWVLVDHWCEEERWHEAAAADPLGALLAEEAE